MIVDPTVTQQGPQPRRTLLAPRSAAPPSDARRCSAARRAAAVLIAAVAIAGCGRVGSDTPLPQIGVKPAAHLTDKQRDAAIKELTEVGAGHEKAALERIEKRQ